MKRFLRTVAGLLAAGAATGMLSAVDTGDWQQLAVAVLHLFARHPLGVLAGAGLLLLANHMPSLLRLWPRAGLDPGAAGAPGGPNPADADAPPLSEAEARALAAWLLTLRTAAVPPPRAPDAPAAS